jgi:hypothetical protein
MESPKQRLSIREYQSVLAEQIINEKRCTFKPMPWSRPKKGKIFILDSPFCLDYVLVENMRFLEQDSNESNKLYQKGYAEISDVAVEEALRDKLLFAFNQMKPSTLIRFEKDSALKLRFASIKNCSSHPECISANDNFNKLAGVTTVDNRRGKGDICMVANVIHSNVRFESFYMSQGENDKQFDIKFTKSSPTNLDQNMSFFDIYNNVMTGVIRCKIVGIYIPASSESSSGGGLESMTEIRLWTELIESHLKSPLSDLAEKLYLCKHSESLAEEMVDAVDTSNPVSG